MQKLTIGDNIGKNSLRIIKLFRKMKNDHTNFPSQGEECLIVAIPRFLDLCEQPRYCKEWLPDVITHYKSNLQSIVGSLKPEHGEKYEQSLSVDLQGVEERLKIMSESQESDTIFARIISHYLLTGQISRDSSIWLSSSVFGAPVIEACENEASEMKKNK